MARVLLFGAGATGARIARQLRSSGAVDTLEIRTSGVATAAVRPTALLPPPLLLPTPARMCKLLRRATRRFVARTIAQFCVHAVCTRRRRHRPTDSARAGRELVAIMVLKSPVNSSHHSGTVRTCTVHVLNSCSLN